MNEQLECVRGQMTENKDNFSTYLESMIQSHDELFCAGDDNETLLKVDLLAGRFKALNDNSKSMNETIAALQNDFGQWKNNTDQEMTSRLTEMMSKLEYITGKFKAMNDKAKQNYDSIIQMQDDMAKYKDEQDNNEKTTDLIEEISTKIDYLDGKFKSLNDNSKTTTATMQSLQEQVTQMSKQHTLEQELVKDKIKKNEQSISSAMASIPSEAAIKLAEDAHNDTFRKLLAEFSDLKLAFEEIKSQQKVSDKPGNTILEDQVHVGKIGDMKNEIDKIYAKIQNIELMQQTAQKAIPAQVDSSALPVAQFSGQKKQYAEEGINVHGIYDRQVTLRKGVAKHHGQLNEMMHVTPNVKRSNPSEIQTYEIDEVEVYHEARDAEEIISDSSPVESRDQE